MDLSTALHKHFGFSGSRPGQALCYQLPALLRDDLTVVVSPLVALMQDQVEALAARGLGNRVALINAQQDGAANARALGAAARGELKLLYVAPERFSSPGFAERMADVDVGLFVVDEAHCVSQWGHDFRPDYFRLADAARYLGAQAIVASTATATPRVANDIVRRLGLRNPVRIATGFDRPNISFCALRPAPHEKHALLVGALKRDDALPAIVYAGTRAGSDEKAVQLREELGVAVEAYHAGLDREQRASVLRGFLAGQIEVVVATNAFGMGVDKADVRTVVHVSAPASLEAYYQEAGRAGRDGKPARALLLAENRDKALHVHFIKRDELDPGLPGWLADRIIAAADGDERYSLDAAELARDLRGDGERLRALIGHLTRAGVIAPSPSAPDRIAGHVTGRFDGRAAALCRTSIEDGASARWRQYREVWAYVEEGACRRTAILRHFGDATAAGGGAGCCDVCDPSLALTTPAPDPVEIGDLDDAILQVATGARPAVGRTTCAEILHGSRSKKIQRNSYDGLPAYGVSSHMRRADILARVDTLIEEGRLETTDGPYPVLRVAA